MCHQTELRKHVRCKPLKKTIASRNSFQTITCMMASYTVKWFHQQCPQEWVYIYMVSFSLVKLAFRWMMMLEPEAQPEQHHIPMVQELLPGVPLCGWWSRVAEDEALPGYQSCSIIENCNKGQCHCGSWWGNSGLPLHTLGRCYKLLEGIGKPVLFIT